MTITLSTLGTYKGEGSEIAAYDVTTQRLFVVAGTSALEVLDLSNPNAPTLVTTIDTSAFGIANSIAVKNGIVAVALENGNSKQAPGFVAFYDLDGNLLNSVTVGALPDMLTFTPDGKKIVVANEGEPNSYNQPDSVDPEGSISIIDLSKGVLAVNQSSVKTADFTAFNAAKNALIAAGVRIFGPNATVAQDLEPEYITVSPDSKTAWVTLQENNALAIVDLETATVKEIKPLGFKDHSLPGNGLDASDRDSGINIQTWPVLGMYQPDAIASFTINGQTYLITANEGDARDYDGFAEEVRVGANSYRLDPTAFPNAATLKNNANLGRLTVTNTLGNVDGDNDFDQIYVFGARSFSIWSASGNLVYDSGDQFEQITATLTPATFNSNGTAATFDTRSDNKGPEPEGVVTGVIDGQTYAFIGLERTGGVMVYNVTNPTSPAFVQYINTPGDLAPEGLAFVAAEDSPTGKSLLVVTNEVSATTTTYEINTASGRGSVPVINGTAGNDRLNGTSATEIFYGFDGNDDIFAGDGNNRVYAGGGNDNVYAGNGNDVLNGGAGNDNLYAAEGNNLLYGGEGNDNLYAGSGNDTIYGNAGNDKIYAGEGNNLILAGDGNDLVYAGAGNDEILGGAGNDSLYAGEGANLIDGGDGNDLIFAGAGNDTIYGGTGNNTINAGEGNNVIFSIGNDVINAGSGSDRFVLGAGSGLATINRFGLNDRIQLTGGLTFADLTVTGNNREATISFGSDAIAILKNFSAAQVNASLFV
ncbi:MAG: choice-of-anchor I family protein [Cyanobacteriota bacterium]